MRLLRVGVRGGVRARVGVGVRVRVGVGVRVRVGVGVRARVGVRQGLGLGSVYACFNFIVSGI